MILVKHIVIKALVALRKESVDRNTCRYKRHTGRNGVALRKESVDRNKIASIGESASIGRSPQGERG